MHMIKVSELTGLALDWAVAQALGVTVRLDLCYESAVCLCTPQDAARFGGAWAFIPSRDWRQGGPIIDALDGFLLKKWLEAPPATCCEAHLHNYEGDWVEFGPTLLIATMRCYVASKLGDTIEIPEELLK